jgi:hypothetical protein
MKNWVMALACLALSCSASDDGNGGGGSGGTGGGGSAGSGGGGGTVVDMAVGTSGGAGGGGGGGTGGAGGGGDVPEYTSGTRIKARVLTSADGAKEYRGWQDTMLNFACYFSVAGDGQYRCLPQGLPGVGPYYSDSNCTTLAVMIQKTSSTCPPPYAITSEATAMCTEYYSPLYRTHVFSMGSALAGSVYYPQGTPATCAAIAPTTGYPYTTYNFYLVGAEVPPTTFASGTVSVQ